MQEKLSPMGKRLVMITLPPPLHAPDPAPGVKTAMVRYVPYSITMPAVDKLTGRLLRGWQFRCAVDRDGRRHCSLEIDATSVLATSEPPSP